MSSDVAPVELPFCERIGLQWYTSFMCKKATDERDETRTEKKSTTGANEEKRKCTEVIVREEGRVKCPMVGCCTRSCQLLLRCGEEA